MYGISRLQHRRRDASQFNWLLCIFQYGSYAFLSELIQVRPDPQSFVKYNEVLCCTQHTVEHAARRRKHKYGSSTSCERAATKLPLLVRRSAALALEARRRYPELSELLLE